MEEVCPHAPRLLQLDSVCIVKVDHIKTAMCPIFRPLQVKYQDKDVIVREGAEANTFYIILKGEVMLV